MDFIIGNTLFPTPQPTCEKTTKTVVKAMIYKTG